MPRSKRTIVVPRFTSSLERTSLLPIATGSIVELFWVGILFIRAHDSRYAAVVRCRKVSPDLQSTMRNRPIKRLKLVILKYDWFTSCRLHQSLSFSAFHDKYSTSRKRVSERKPIEASPIEDVPRQTGHNCQNVGKYWSSYVLVVEKKILTCQSHRTVYRNSGEGRGNSGDSEVVSSSSELGSLELTQDSALCTQNGTHATSTHRHSITLRCVIVMNMRAAIRTYVCVHAYMMHVWTTLVFMRCSAVIALLNTWLRVQQEGCCSTSLNIHW